MKSLRRGNRESEELEERGMKIERERRRERERERDREREREWRQTDRTDRASKKQKVKR